MEKRRGILVVSYGTGYKDALENALGGIEKAIAEAYPDCKVYRAFTSQPIIDKLKKISCLEVDNAEQALERMVSDGITELIVQQTHLLKDSRYNKLAGILAAYEKRFKDIRVSEPLLSGCEDVKAVLSELIKWTEGYDDNETAICLVGHGADSEAADIYSEFQNKLKDFGYNHYYVGTISSPPTLADIREELKIRAGYKRVVILPLMLVSGFHVRKDIIGKRADSWKNVFESDGYAFECIQHGLGENPAIQQMYVSHVRTAMGNN